MFHLRIDNDWLLLFSSNKDWTISSISLLRHLSHGSFLVNNFALFMANEAAFTRTRMNLNMRPWAARFCRGRCQISRAHLIDLSSDLAIRIFLLVNWGSNSTSLTWNLLGMTSSWQNSFGILTFENKFASGVGLSRSWVWSQSRVQDFPISELLVCCCCSLHCLSRYSSLFQRFLGSF